MYFVYHGIDLHFSFRFAKVSLSMKMKKLKNAPSAGGKRGNDDRKNARERMNTSMKRIWNLLESSIRIYNLRPQYVDYGCGAVLLQYKHAP